MNTRFCVKSCQISACCSAVPVVRVTLYDKKSKKSWELTDWLIDETHIDRTDSLLTQDPNKYPSNITRTDLFDLIDEKLAEINSNPTPKDTLFTQIKHLIWG